MQLTEISPVLAIVMIAGTLSGVIGYFLMRRKFMRELKKGKKHEEELARKVYEIAILKEIGDRIGYSLDGTKIVEIISGSLGELLPYLTVSHLTINEKSKKLLFSCSVRKSVSPLFVREVKTKMLAAFSEMIQKPVLESEVDESISGVLLDDRLVKPVGSYFNLPIVISKKLAGLINVASTEENLYNDENTEVLFRIARQASDAVSKLQEVLENEKSRLSQAVQSLSDGLLMVDTNYQLVLSNQKLSELLGIGGTPSIFEIVNALSGTLDLRTKVEEALAKDAVLPVCEISVKDKVLQVVASRVLDKKTLRPTGVVVLFHDATDAKSLERLKQEFMAMMVHELRAPLTSIKSTAEVLNEKDFAQIKADEFKKSVEVIDSTSKSMLVLVNDLLDVAKMEAGKFDVVCEEGDVGTVVEERVESFRPGAQEKNLGLNIVVEENLPSGWFDKVRIKQVLNNLLSNAIKYTESGGINVRVSRETVNRVPVDILVSIADTGIGIERQDIGKLFSKFGQLASGRRGAGLKSTGLGLYIAREIVEAWGGKIGVKSEGAGTGSTFYFTVPLADSVKKGKKNASGLSFEEMERGYSIN